MSYTRSEVEHIMIKDRDERYKLMLDCDLASVDLPYKKLMSHMLQMIHRNQMFAMQALDERDVLRSNINNILDAVYVEPNEDEGLFFSDKDKLDYMEQQFFLMGFLKSKIE